MSREVCSWRRGVLTGLLVVCCGSLASLAHAAPPLLTVYGSYVAPFGRLYVGFVEDRPACCSALRPHDPESGELKRLFVRAAFRGRGFGVLLARKIIADAVEIGFRCLVLDTLPTLIAAQRMYEQLGFSDIPGSTHNPVGGARFMELTLAKLADGSNAQN